MRIWHVRMGIHVRDPSQSYCTMLGGENNVLAIARCDSLWCQGSYFIFFFLLLRRATAAF